MKMANLLAFMGLSPGELIIVLAVVLLLFGASKIPQLMRSMGQGLSEFKKGVKEGEKDAAEDAKKEEAKPAAGEAEKK